MKESPQQTDGKRSGTVPSGQFGIMSLLRGHSTVQLALPILLGAISGLSKVVVIGVLNYILANYERHEELLPYFAGLTVLVAVTEFGSGAAIARMNANLTLSLRDRFSEIITRVPLIRVETAGRATVVANLTIDMERIAFAVATLPSVFVETITILGLVAYLAFASSSGLAVIVVGLLFGLPSAQFFIRRSHRRFGRSRAAADQLYLQIRALLDGLSELKLNRLRRREFLRDVLHEAGVGVRDNESMADIWANGARGWVVFVTLTILGLCLFLIPTEGGTGTTEITASVVVVLFLQKSISTIMEKAPRFSAATASMQQLKDLMDSLQEGAPTAEQVPLDLTKRSDMFPRLINVEHKYFLSSGELSFALGPIDLELKPSEILFVVGGNGGGKTTLAKVLTGLYPPTTGEVWFGDQLITDATRDDYRQQFSSVLTDYYLFDRLLGVAASKEDEARTLLAQFGIGDKITITDGVLSTTSLSRGQRKRLGLVISYLDDRPFYVFDEWAADQEPYFRELFYTEFLPALRDRGKSIVAITHDDQFFHIADRTVRLDFGGIITPGELGPRAMLGEILLSEGTITGHQLSQALHEHKASQGAERVGDALVRLGVISQETLERFLKHQERIRSDSSEECSDAQGGEVLL